MSTIFYNTFPIIYKNSQAIKIC